MSRLPTTLAAVLLFAACASCSRDVCGDSQPQSFNYYYDLYKLDPASAEAIEPGVIRVTFLGATTLLFDDGESEILIDAFVSRSGMLKVGMLPLHSDPSMVDRVVQHGQMERLAAVFITHSHYDHVLDAAAIIKAAEAGGRADTEATLRAQRARPASLDTSCTDQQAPLRRIALHGSESTLNVGRGGALQSCQLVLLRPGEEVSVGAFRLRALLSKHSPATLFNGDAGEAIDREVRQPGRARAYKEGGTYDFLITHGTRSILVKSSANYIEGMLEGIHPDVAFLSIGRLGKQCCRFRNKFYEQAVRVPRPRLVVATHWDDFFGELDEALEPACCLVDDVPAGLQFLGGRLEADGIQFGLMQGFQKVDLFDGNYPRN